MVYKIEYVDIYEGGYGHTTIEADSNEEACNKFEAESDGCAVVFCSEITK